MAVRSNKVFFKSIVFVLMISVTLSGCNPSGNAGSRNNDDVASEPASTSDTSKNQLKGNLELQIFVGGFGEEFWNEAIALFKKENPQVNIIKHMGPNVNIEMAPRWKSGNPPDFAYVDGVGIHEDEIVDLLLDLRDWINSSVAPDGTNLIKDKVYKGLIRVEDDGRICFLPYIFGAIGMWYDARLFKDNNLPVPANFEEFLELAPLLKEKNIALIVYPGKYPVYLFKGLMRQNIALLGGQQSINDISDLKPGIFLSDVFYKTMYKLELLAKTDNGVLEGSLESDHIKAQMDWLQRKAAFIPNGLWLENEMKGNIPADFEMTFIPSLIQDKGQRYVICANTHPLCLAKQGKNLDAAKAWLSFLCREDILKRFTEITGVPTAYKMDLSDANVSELVKNVQRWIADPNICFVYEKSLASRIETVLNEAINDVIAGKIDAREACERLQKEADEMLAEKSK